MELSEISSCCTTGFADKLPSYIVDAQWRPRRSGDYKADCRVGREIAEDVLERIATDDNPLHLNSMARCIVEAGQWGAVEIGFFTRIARSI